MRKLLISLACASIALPGVSQASTFQDIATLSFKAVSDTASFLFSWGDLISTNRKLDQTLESNGKYSLSVTDKSTHEILYSNNNIANSVTGDVSGAWKGSFTQSFASLTVGKDYTVNFIGKWNGSSGKNWGITETPFVSVTAVPEPETYAMFLAGLGIIGVIATRRNRV